jgi:hypothetical protein
MEMEDLGLVAKNDEAFLSLVSRLRLSPNGKEKLCSFSERFSLCRDSRAAIEITDLILADTT